MTPAYIPKHFKIEELLPQGFFLALAKADRLAFGWMCMDERILRHADQCRDAFGALTCNNWHTGGPRNESGLRLPGMVNYSDTSQHSYGRATDMISASLSGDDMRKYILSHPDKFPHVTALEAGVSWLHSDVRNCQRITVFNP